MVGVIQHIRDGLPEKDDEQCEEGTGTEQRDKSRLIDALGIIILAVYEAEETRLHTISKDDEQQRSPGIQVRHDTIVVLLHQHIGVERN